LKIKASKCEVCPYHTEEKSFEDKTIFPNNICPILYHTIYPYFLSLFYGAKFDYNKKGDCNVGCPAINGVDTLIKKRENNGLFDSRISKDMKFVIFAEVINVGECPNKHKIGDKFIFPTCMKEYYICPGGLNNVFPFIDIEIPKCIDKTKLRCPDWNVNIMYNLGEKE